MTENMIHTEKLYRVEMVEITPTGDGEGHARTIGSVFGDAALAAAGADSFARHLRAYMGRPPGVGPAQPTEATDRPRRGRPPGSGRKATVDAPAADVAPAGLAAGGNPDNGAARVVNPFGSPNTAGA